MHDSVDAGEPHVQGASAPAPMNGLVAAELDAWMRLGTTVVDALAAHPVALSESGAEAFQARIAEFSRELKQRPGSSKVLIASGGITQTLQHYNSQVQRQIESQRDALQSLLNLALAQLEALSPDDATVFASLRADVKSAAPDQFPALVETASATLLAATQRGAAQRKHHEEVIQTLRDRIDNAERPGSAGSPGLAAAVRAAMDTSTGLPLRPEAEVALQRALASRNTGVYVAMFYIHRVKLTSTRFGSAVADQVLLFCSQHMATRLLQSHDLLFRWDGPIFVGILEREDEATTVVSEVQRAANAPLSRFFETSSRSVYLPIKTTCDVFSASGQPLDDALAHIEQFVAKTRPLD